MQLSEEVVRQVQDKVGSMWPLSSVGADEVEAVVRAALVVAFTRITATGIGRGTAIQTDKRLIALAKAIEHPATKEV